MFKNAQELGYKVGDKFKIVSDGYPREGFYDEEDGMLTFNKGSTVVLKEDDASSCPMFSMDGVPDSWIYIALDDLEKIEDQTHAIEDSIHRSSKIGFSVSSNALITNISVNKHLSVETIQKIIELIKE